MTKGPFEEQNVQSSDSALRQYLRTIQRQAWLVVLVPVLVLVAMFVVTKAQDKTYRASMTLVVGTQEVKGPPQLGDHSLTRNMTTLLESDYITRTVIRNLGLDMTASEFKKRLSVDVLPETSVLDVSYDSTDRELARNVVAEIARIYPSRVDATLGTRRPGQPRSLGSFDLVVRVFDRPHVQADAVGPKTGTNLIFGGVAGLALGLLLAVAREALDSRMRERKEAEEWFGAPIVGMLPKGMTGRPPPGVGVPARAGDARRFASLDLLRARLEFSHVGVHGPTILVAGAGPEMGKSAVVANIGAAFARGGKRVILVDADMRHPRLHRSLGLTDIREQDGLVEVLAGQVELREALIPIEIAQPGGNGAGPTEPVGRLELLTSGSPSAELGADALTPEALASLIRRLRERADYVVFDSPPLMVAESYTLAVQSDSVLVVARRGRTTKDQAEWARATLDELGVERIGVVITDSPPI
jgi:Mrp family chromosome partitioning ATPase/capsular polysaccharide biosynthesis protein